MPTPQSPNTLHNQEPAMNTTRQAAAQRLTAFSLALVMTLAMLVSVDRFATSEPTAAQLARAEAMHGARS